MARRGLAIGAATIAVALTAFAAVRLWEDLRVRSSETTFSVLRDAMPVSTADVKAAVAAYREAGVSDPQRLADLSYGAMVLGLRNGIDTDEGKSWLRSAVSDIAIQLASSPGDAYAWTRYAALQQILGDTDMAAHALVMSMQMSRADQSLMPMQLVLAADLWSTLTPDEQESAIRMARYGWANYRVKGIFDDLHRKPGGRDLIRAAFAGQADVVEAYPDVFVGISQSP